MIRFPARRAGSGMSRVLLSKKFPAERELCDPKKLSEENIRTVRLFQAKRIWRLKIWLVIRRTWNFLPGNSVMLYDVNVSHIRGYDILRVILVKAQHIVQVTSNCGKLLDIGAGREYSTIQVQLSGVSCLEQGPQSILPALISHSSLTEKVVLEKP